MNPFYRSTMKLLLCFLLVLSSLPSMYSQMLFSENLTMRIDSTKRIQGTLLPVLEFKTEKENVFTFKNNLNLMVKHGQIINLINKIELSTYGDKVTVSGGYVHAEYRYLLNRAFEIYPYAESQWAESRGMKFKVSTGLQSRCRLVNSANCLLFATVGLFYEFEKWEQPATSPLAGTDAYSRSIKSHLSLSFKHQLGERWELITTAIHQGKPDSYLKEARFGGAVDLKYRITPTIGIRGAYRIIYDTAPIVPVLKDYNTLDVGIDLSF